MVESEKTRFLIVDDYGTGGIWGCVWARSAGEVARRFRNGLVSDGRQAARRDGSPRGGDVVVFTGRPAWMSAEEEGRIAAKKPFDIDTIEPSDYFARFLRNPN